jgi:hypothetical protein
LTQPRVLKFSPLFRADISLDSEFFKQQALRARDLAEKANPFTRKRLLDLADRYDAKAGDCRTDKDSGSGVLPRLNCLAKT